MLLGQGVDAKLAWDTHQAARIGSDSYGRQRDVACNRNDGTWMSRRNIRGVRSGCEGRGETRRATR